ncbi:Isoleucine--tRNA ligase [Gryllus bimaculatus]|nr:Isoleucine--tRNA ligase [Gryllus bimaculatus]
MELSLEAVPETIDFPGEEEKILELWKKLDVFQTCLKQSEGKPRYSFYDGPPFATGLPHYGHILAGTIKDIVTRYAHQKGFHVERRFGWDCHGLPVEFEIDKTLNIRGPEDVARMGIDKYNAECRKIVTRYAKDWEVIVGRLGRWIDFKNDYKTLYPWFMESIWWVFKELFNKGLVYKGVKVMPFSTTCNTPLSNFESGQNYKEVVDPAVMVGFPLIDEPDVQLIAWTTTPWTLPSNLTLCVNPNLQYVLLQDLSTNKKYILMEDRISALYKTEDQYKILKRFKGETLKGKRYKPLFPYFQQMSSKGAFQVLNDNYVTAESGTGIVHQAPYFGEDDHRVCLAAGIITRDQEVICPVDNSGRFTFPVVDFQGQHVKDADKNIIKWLKESGRLVNASTVKHSYPFCWRSDTPLIYKAVPSWFVRVEHMATDLLRCNQDTYWVPDFIKEKRFGNWLKEARDWAISRNRYWGTPIPLWISDDGLEIVCVGSIKELEELTGKKVNDLHRESIDNLEIPSHRPGRPPLRRVPEVFDCWFESGSMPYAQYHYPFERKNEFEASFPADFIAEGIDQTRGWFYTLLVISTALFNKPPFKNLIASGLVLASDGQKMSKRKKNYPDPMEVVNKYGADALRLYLINSPVVRAESLRFKEDGVRDVLKDVFLPWYNAYRFLVQNIERLGREDGKVFQYTEGNALSENLMDRWILSFTQSLMQFVHKEMTEYRLYTVVPRLVKFIDNLTNWYVRMNRRRLKGEGGVADCENALNTLFSVLYSMIHVMAPFTPFLTELMYQNLRRTVAHNNPSSDSIHYLMMPESNTSLIDKNIEQAVSRMQTVIDLGRIIRDRKTLPIKYPLPEVVVIHQNQNVLNDVKCLERYILEELNVRQLTLSADKAKYGVSLRAEPDHKVLGARLKGAFKEVTSAIRELSDDKLQKFLVEGHIELLGHTLNVEDIRIMFRFASDSNAEVAQRYEAHGENDMLVLVDISPDASMQEEGLAREFINRIQKLRKKAHLVPSDPVTVYYVVESDVSDIASIAVSHKNFIESNLKTPLRPFPSTQLNNIIIEEKQQLKGSMYVNVCLDNKLQPRLGATSSRGTILLENPAGQNILNLQQLKEEINILFGLFGCHYNLGPCASPEKLAGQTVYIYNENTKFEGRQSCSLPQVPFINVSAGQKKFTFLLENPMGYTLTDMVKLRRMITSALGVDEKTFLQKNESLFSENIQNGATLVVKL